MFERLLHPKASHRTLEIHADSLAVIRILATVRQCASLVDDEPIDPRLYLFV